MKVIALRSFYRFAININYLEENVLLILSESPLVNVENYMKKKIIFHISTQFIVFMIQEVRCNCFGLYANMQIC